MSQVVKLRFCPEDNDLLYPTEDKDRQKLIYKCRSCPYEEDVPVTDWCINVNHVQHTDKERTVVLYKQDLSADPTLPRTRDVECPQCHHKEAAYFSVPTAEGMTLYFNCTNCGHKWRDYI